jgi:hypothetical protein
MAPSVGWPTRLVGQGAGRQGHADRAPTQSSPSRRILERTSTSYFLTAFAADGTSTRLGTEAPPAGSTKSARFAHVASPAIASGPVHTRNDPGCQGDSGRLADGGSIGGFARAWKSLSVGLTARTDSRPTPMNAPALAPQSSNPPASTPRARRYLLGDALEGAPTTANCSSNARKASSSCSTTAG